ncbi:MAG: DNA-3-methyladenine glycosylase 2 family protein [Saprospiraceae bacterium]|nr:DNA-3-methyladenine glycosylase 2 family protein [Saprospiraceae bacterium]
MSRDAFLFLKEKDILSNIVEHEIEPLKLTNDLYLDILESIVSQQLSLKVASVIYSRFLAAFPDQYPDPTLISEMDIESLRNLGLSYAKCSYIKSVATFELENGIRNRDWTQYSNEEITLELTKIKGIGKWTAEMVLMFSLQREDVFSVDDLVIQQTMKSLFQLSDDKKILKKQMLSLSEEWSPYRTYACRYLWKSREK